MSDIYKKSLMTLPWDYREGDSWSDKKNNNLLLDRMKHDTTMNNMFRTQSNKPPKSILYGCLETTVIITDSVCDLSNTLARDRCDTCNSVARHFYSFVLTAHMMDSNKLIFSKSGCIGLCGFNCFGYRLSAFSREENLIFSIHEQNVTYKELSGAFLLECIGIYLHSDLPKLVLDYVRPSMN